MLLLPLLLFSDDLRWLLCLAARLQLACSSAVGALSLRRLWRRRRSCCHRGAASLGPHGYGARCAMGHVFSSCWEHDEEGEHDALLQRNASVRPSEPPAAVHGAGHASGLRAAAQHDVHEVRSGVVTTSLFPGSEPALPAPEAWLPAASGGVLGLVSVGIIGTGRSSFFNTLLNSKDVCKVSGGQLRGTRGCELMVKRASVAYAPLEDADDSGEEGAGARARAGEAAPFTAHLIDSEGLRSDSPVKAEELRAFADALCRSVKLMPGGSVTHVLLSLDVEERQTLSSLSNLLALCEMLRDARASCFLCLTKFNSNSVTTEWNRRLYEWNRSNRRAKSAAGLPAPPAPQDMLADYVAYFEHKFNTPTEQGALARMRRLLAFFEGRVLWAYNLDHMQWEDREEGELPAHEEFLFRHYRDLALSELNAVRHPVAVKDLVLVREQADLLSLATRCVAAAAV